MRVAFEKLAAKGVGGELHGGELGLAGEPDRNCIAAPAHGEKLAADGNFLLVARHSPDTQAGLVAPATRAVGVTNPPSPTFPDTLESTRPVCRFCQRGNTYAQRRPGHLGVCPACSLRPCPDD